MSLTGMDRLSSAGKDRRHGSGRRLWLAVGLFLVWSMATVASASAHTIVSLSFDDGLSSATRAGKILASHGLPASFFVITGDVGKPGHLGWSEIAQLAAEGHEIGSHTVTHPDLPERTPAEQEEQLCDSRRTLNEHGYQALSFAYPHGDFNTETLRLLAKCGYTAARLFGNQQGGTDALDGTEVYPEPFSLEFEGHYDPYELSVLGTNEEPVPLSYLEDSVTWGLEGWVIIALHGVCNYTGHPSECERETPECTVEAAECTPSTYGSVSPADLEAFATWLSEQPDLAVRTIGQVVNDKTPPTTSIACDGSPCSRPHNKPVSVSLAATDSETMVETTTYTTDGSEPTASSTVYTEPITVSETTTVKYRSWDVRGKEEPVQTKTVEIITIPPVTTIEDEPRTLSNVKSPSFAFVANEASTFECSLDGAAFTACVSPVKFQGLADGSHTFEVRATDLAENVEPTPVSYTWTIDTVPPVTTVDGEPRALSNVKSPSFSFVANESSTFECSLDGSAFAACASPVKLDDLADGSHTFAVRATDLAGNVEPTPVSYTWTIDTTLPVTAIENEPLELSNVKSPSFSFVADELSTFECSLDGAGYKACVSPVKLDDLADGSHTFEVRATDGAGNVEPTPVSYAWTIDTVPPVTTIESESLTDTGGASVSIPFSVGKPATTECSLDGAPFLRCSSPYVATGLSVGWHTLCVLATDKAGNVESEPASYTWLVLAPPPNATAAGDPNSAEARSNESGVAVAPAPSPNVSRRPQLTLALSRSRPVPSKRAGRGRHAAARRAAARRGARRKHRAVRRGKRTTRPHVGRARSPS